MSIAHGALADTFAAHTHLPARFVSKRIEALKAARMIATGRPAQPLSPQDVARICVSLAASRHATAAEFVTAVGGLRLYQGTGPATAEAALIDLVEGATFAREPAFDLAGGDVTIGQNFPSLTIRAHRHDGKPHVADYRIPAPPGAACTSTTYPISTVVAIARDVLLRTA